MYKVEKREKNTSKKITYKEDQRYKVLRVVNKSFEEHYLLFY